MTRTLIRSSFALVCWCVAGAATPASTQTLGTFAWQIAPYCNVVHFGVTVDGPALRLTGFDDQCGGAQLPAAGTATARSDGQFGLSFYIVTPTGLVSHVTAVVNPASISGPWSDSSGMSGALTFNPPLPAGGPLRPAPLVPTIAIAPGAVTAAQVADGAIGTAEIADSSVTSAKLQLPLQAETTSSAPGILITQYQPQSIALQGRAVGAASTGVYGEGRESGVQGQSSTGVGVVGVTSNLGGAAVAGVSFGEGAGIAGQAAGTGHAARIENIQAANVADVVSIESAGTGDLIEASQGGQVKFRVTAAGGVQGDGAYSPPAADVAEFIDVVDALTPGDVVEIDPANDGHFRRAVTPASHMVAGVVTTRPGVLLNARDGRHAVADGPALALVGRVPVKVSAENGAIARGDLLIASATPGHAMKAPAAPASGTVIGKSLGALASGTGIVEMLVMLR